MARPELHSVETLLDTARQLVLEGGARAATVDGIVAASGAPKGSIYHRFATLNDLLAAMWLRAVRRSQERFLSGLAEENPVEAAVAAGLAIHDFALDQSADARLLASLRLEDLLGSVLDSDLRDSLRDINAPLEVALVDLTRRLYGRASRAGIERTMFAVIDLPHGSIRRHLTSAKRPPPGLRLQVEAAMRAALER